MSHLVPSNKIYMSSSLIEGAGRGVFACVDIFCGEIIEECPVVDLSQDDFSSLKETLLVNYYFLWGETYDQVSVALGFGSLYNHSYSPNAQYIKRFDKQLIEFVALRDIKKNDEILVNYNGNPDDTSKLWMKDIRT